MLFVGDNRFNFLKLPKLHTLENHFTRRGGLGAFLYGANQLRNRSATLGLVFAGRFV